jgi:dUTP pyrophosphatase
MIFHASCPHCKDVFQTRELVAHELVCRKTKDMSEKIRIKFKRLHAKAVAPSLGTGRSAGWDLCAFELECVKKDVWAYKTGIAVEIPPGYVGLVSLRSSVGKQGRFMPNAPGIIDSDYRGEIVVLIKEELVDFTTGEPLVDVGRTIRKYETNHRIAQLVIHKLPDVEFVEVAELSSTARGDGGFGLTGT